MSSNPNQRGLSKGHRGHGQTSIKQSRRRHLEAIDLLPGDFNLVERPLVDDIHPHIQSEPIGQRHSLQPLVRGEHQRLVYGVPLVIGHRESIRLEPLELHPLGARLLSSLYQSNQLAEIAVVCVGDLSQHIGLRAVLF